MRESSGSVVELRNYCLINNKWLNSCALREFPVGVQLHAFCCRKCGEVNYRLTGDGKEHCRIEPVDGEFFLRFTCPNGPKACAEETVRRVAHQTKVKTLGGVERIANRLKGSGLLGDGLEEGDHRQILMQKSVVWNVSHATPEELEEGKNPIQLKDLPSAKNKAEINHRCAAGVEKVDAAFDEFKSQGRRK